MELSSIDWTDHDQVVALVAELELDAEVVPSGMSQSPYWYIEFVTDRSFICISPAEEYGEGFEIWVGEYEDESLEHQKNMHDITSMHQLKSLIAAL